MLTLEDLIQRIESSKQIREQAKRMFEDGTMQMHRNNEKVPCEESIAELDRFITQDEECIAALKALQAIRIS